ncbi:MAG: glycine oxidase ThiO [Elusimicrobiota bacterium]
MSNKFDVIILGSGIIGSTCAYELAKAGKRVLIVDNAEAHKSASKNSAAMLEFQLDAHRGEPFYSLAQASMNLFPLLSKEIQELTKIDFQFEQKGILQIALNEYESDTLQKEAMRQKKLGLGIEWLPPKELKERLPNLSLTMFGAIFYEEDGQVNGEKFLEALQKGAELKGAQFSLNHKKISIEKNKKDVTGVLVDNELIEASWVLVCAGAWSDLLLEPLGFRLGIEPIRGQLVVYSTPKNEVPFPVYTKSGGYIAPKKDQFTLAGTTVERAGFNNETTSEGEEVISHFSKTLFPHFSKTKKIKMTSGLRPKSPDELPALGPIFSIPHLLVAAGHFRNGILLAPITAKLMTSFVLGAKFDVDPTPFSPERFLQIVAPSS